MCSNVSLIGHAAGNRAGQDPVTRRRILAKPIESQRSLMLVDVSQRLGQGVVGNNRQDGTENFFAHDSHAVVHIEQQGWRQLSAGGSQGQIRRLDLNDGRPAPTRILDQLAQTPQMAFADDRGIVRSWAEFRI